MVEVTGKFVSPFTADSVQQLDETATDGIPFVMPDTSLFDDSLGDDFHPKCLNAILPGSVMPAENLDDSLSNEETQLPSVEPEPTNVDNIGMEMTECKVSSRNLDDSLCSEMDEETQCHIDKANKEGPLSRQISPTAQNVPTSFLDDSMDMGSTNLSSSIPQAKLGESTGTPMSPCESKSEENSQDNQPATASKVVPSFGKKKKGFVPPAAKAPGPPNSTVMKPTPKIAPSSAKMKKSKCKTVKLDKSAESEQKLDSDANKENSLSGGGNQKPKSSPLKADTSVSTNSKRSAAKAPVADSMGGKGTIEQVAQENKSNDSKKTEKEKKKLQKEQKMQEREKKKLEQEQKRAEKERQKEEKRLEQERKQVEREQRKLEKELKKLEREQKRAQKQQKSMTSGNGSLVQKSSISEPLLQHDTSHEEETGKCSPTVSDMCTTVEVLANSGVISMTKSTDKLSATDSTSPPESTSPRPDAHSSIAETIDPPPDCNAAAYEGAATTSSEACGVEGDHVREGIQCETMLFSSSGEASTEDFSSSAVSNCKQPTNFDKTGGDGTSKKSSSNPLGNFSVTKKDSKKVPKMVAVKKTNLQMKEPIARKGQGNKTTRKEMSRSVMLHKKYLSSSPGQGSKTKSSKTQLKEVEEKFISIPRISAGSRKRKAVEADSITSCSESECEPMPKKPRSKHSNYYGPVWVQCDKVDCQKWRQLKDCRDPSEVPEQWICSMNTEPAYSTCSAAEEQWSEPGESQEFVESPFIPGSIVWAKMEGYPWWPAMVEEDPDEETYYEMGDQNSNSVPVKYHVVFFDTPVCRAWVFAPSVQVFSENSDANEAGNVFVAQKHKRALKEGIKQAKKASKMTVEERLSRLTFIKRFHSKKRKQSFSDDPVNDNTQHSSRRGGAKPSNKSARLNTSKLIKHNNHDSQQQVKSTDERMTLSVAVESVPSN